MKFYYRSTAIGTTLTYVDPTRTYQPKQSIPNPPTYTFKFYCRTILATADYRCK